MRRSVMFFFLATFFCSCGSDSVFEEITGFEDDEWVASDTATFNFTIRDSTKAYNVYYDVRYNNEYPFYNLYVTQILLDSAGKTLIDEEQEIILFDRKTGAPIGSGFGNTLDHRILSRKELSFPYVGEYTFRVAQQMRKDTLPGISNLGIAIKDPSEEE